MPKLQGKRILLGVTGSIAAYKACELIRLLSKEGASVKVVMTESALRFVGKASFEALSGNRVFTSMWSDDSGLIPHIELRDHTDLILIAPATANIMAKIAGGFADDLLSSTVLARTCPLMIAPAMNMRMWQNEATQRNVRTIRSFGDAFFSGPAKGEQACGDVGSGRFKEPKEIVEDVIRLFSPSTLEGRKVLITAGPTQEPIDPVRAITNSSSGRQGFEIAKAALRAGAEVTLVAGPVALETPEGARRIDVTTAREMERVVMDEITAYRPNVFVSVAAVSDWGVRNPSDSKIKKNGDYVPKIDFTQNPDILSEVGHLPGAPLCVGFAAETDDIVENAKKKLAGKRARLIVANNAAAIGKADNEAFLVENGKVTPTGLLSKEELSERIIEKISELLAPNH